MFIQVNSNYITLFLKINLKDLIDIDRFDMLVDILVDYA